MYELDIIEVKFILAAYNKNKTICHLWTWSCRVCHCVNWELEWPSSRHLTFQISSDQTSHSPLAASSCCSLVTEPPLFLAPECGGCFRWHSEQNVRNLEMASLGMNAYWSAIWNNQSNTKYFLGIFICEAQCCVCREQEWHGIWRLNSSKKCIL